MNAAELKQAAAGRWREILVSVGGIEPALLDGKNHPCPKCGGKDRFRLIDADAGACYCNRCFSSKNGDGIAALQWLTGMGFREALAAINEQLGLNGRVHRSNGHQASANGKPRIIGTYDYRAEKGQLLYQVVRFDPKDFRQRRPKPGGGWQWSVKGMRVVPYRLPELLAADPAELVLVCEGEKDVDRLTRLGLVATCNVGGAGKWRPEYNQHFSGRRVAVLPDNDDPGRKHAHEVAQNLHAVAARVKVVELPGLPSKGDVSDWLDAGGTVEDLLRLVDASPDWRPVEGSVQVERRPASGAKDKQSTVKLLADTITASNHFARDPGGRLYRFADGAYRVRGEGFVKGRVKAECLRLNLVGHWSTRLAAEVVEYIAVDAPELWQRPTLDVLNVKNGLLRLAGRELLPHDPGHLSTVQLPVAFDPAARCPDIDKFVAQVFPPDAVSLAYEIPAWLMLPDTSIQKAILLTGEGANGKSTYLTLVMAFLGRSNVSGLSLHRLESDKFAVARLLGKLANICPDLPSEHLVGTSIFKALTGGDILVGEHKFKDSFELAPFARLVFSANHPPRSSDASHAFFRRWLVIPFERTFAPEEQIPRKILDARLSTPTELSGLLNSCLDILPVLREREALSEPESVKQAWREFHATTDPLAVWLDRCTVEQPEALVAKDVLRAAYGADCQRAGRPPLTDTAFGRAMAKLRPRVEKLQRTINGKVQWCYIGLGMKGSEQQDSESGDNWWG